MRRWRITPAGRVVIAAFVVCVAAGVAAPRPWNGAGLFVAAMLFLGVMTDGWHALPPVSRDDSRNRTDDERVALFRRIYRPRRRA